MDIEPHLRRAAFRAYLRNGASPALTLRQARETTHYRSRTRRDGRVRPSHAANDGKIFAWEAPPETGHPGAAPGCRCVAEPYRPETTEFVDLTMSDIGDTGSAWRSEAFVHHYFFGGGRGVTLRETGHLRAVASAYAERVGPDLKRQIASEARGERNGGFTYVFSNSYRMTDVVFSLGWTSIGGTCRGSARAQHGIVSFEGVVNFHLDDEFVDPLGLTIEIIGGTPYAITDRWAGRVEGRVYLDASRSRYVW